MKRKTMANSSDKRQKVDKRAAASTNDSIEPREIPRVKALSRLFTHPQWDNLLFNKGQVWIGIKAEGTTIVGDCFDTQTMTPSESAASPFTTTVNDKTSSFACKTGFRVHGVTPRTLEISYDQLPTVASRATFHLPSKTFDKVFTKNIVNVDVHSSGQYGAAVCGGEMLKIWNIETEEIQDTIKMGEMNTVKWVPSPQPTVAFSCDANSIKLYSVDRRRTFRTLRGHSAKVHELLFLEKGKHLFSSAQDGTVRLWDINRADPIMTVVLNFGATVKCLSVQTADTSIREAYEATAKASPPDPALDGRVLLYGGDDQHLKIVSLLQRTPTMELFKFTMEGRSIVESCTFLDHPYFACGTDTGQVLYFDWRRPDRPLSHWRETRGSINCMAGYKGGVICGAADGSCFYRNPVQNERNDVSWEFCGGDEQISRLCVYNGTLVTACLDGRIRKYRLP
ncbi:hypothetical protein RvY_16449 [Ramazzottius varieornatus]|uniref:Uncharacterized protein n=1 Tax=Ramazzottius varieornatus TaxID=947166 RepID=A0A1D1VYI4_RAMVA|nr:hypothetical protein RvY_16449 [Ramazzottius varieornatus]